MKRSKGFCGKTVESKEEARKRRSKIKAIAMIDRAKALGITAELTYNAEIGEWTSVVSEPEDLKKLHELNY